MWSFCIPVCGQFNILNPHNVLQHALLCADQLTWISTKQIVPMNAPLSIPPLFRFPRITRIPSRIAVTVDLPTAASPSSSSSPPQNGHQTNSRLITRSTTRKKEATLFSYPTVANFSWSRKTEIQGSVQLLLSFLLNPLYVADFHFKTQLRLLPLVPPPPLFNYLHRLTLTFTRCHCGDASQTRIRTVGSVLLCARWKCHQTSSTSQKTTKSGTSISINETPLLDCCCFCSS